MDLSRPVRRIGIPWGGLALFVNVEFMQRILRHKPDVLIGGETDSYGLFFAIDSGVPLIEVGRAALRPQEAFGGPIRRPGR